MTAICLIPNCGHPAPASEPFCPAHRDVQWDGSPLDEKQQAAVSELRRLIAQGRAAMANE